MGSPNLSTKAPPQRGSSLKAFSIISVLPKSSLAAITFKFGRRPSQNPGPSPAGIPLAASGTSGNSMSWPSPVMASLIALGAAIILSRIERSASSSSKPDSVFVVDVVTVPAPSGNAKPVIMNPIL